MTPARAAIFDLGGVLIRWRPEAGLAGLFETEAALADALAAVDFEAWNAALDDPALAPAIAPEATWFAAYRDGVAAAHAEAIPGAVQLLERLHAAGIPLYAISNTARRSLAAIRAVHPFMALFEDVAISAVEGARKPDPAIYRALLVRNGLAVERCVFIDDGARYVDGARAVGMRGVLFETPEQCAAALRAEGLPT